MNCTEIKFKFENETFLTENFDQSIQWTRVPGNDQLHSRLRLLLESNLRTHPSAYKNVKVGRYETERIPNYD